MYAHSPSKFSLVLFLSVLFLEVNALKVLSTEEKSCKVTTDLGQIDLSSVARSDGQPRFTKAPSGTGGSTFLWNPCNNFNGKQNACNQVELCAVYSGGYEMSMGTKDQSNFTVQSNTLVLQYSTQSTVMVNIKLICGTGDTDDFELGTNQDYWTWSLTSKHACFNSPTTNSPSTGSGGLSVGSVLCIILFVVIVLYLVTAGIYFKVNKNIDSYKHVPHYKLCQSTFSYAKDGLMFSVKCGKPGDTSSSSKGYESI